MTGINKKIMQKACAMENNRVNLHTLLKKKGVIAQLVEQRTENPCVPGSIPGDTTRGKTC